MKRRIQCDCNKDLPIKSKLKHYSNVSSHRRRSIEHEKTRMSLVREKKNYPRKGNQFTPVKGK